MTDPLKGFGALVQELLRDAGVSPSLQQLMAEILTPEEREATEEKWWEELEFGKKPTLDEAKKAYRRLMNRYHTDRPDEGDREWKTKKMARLHAAIAKAKEELG